MLPQSVLFGLLMAMKATASPTPAIDSDMDLAPRDLADGEMELFDRDMVLDKRDLELADLHGVNTTEMFKHSVIKRHDGDDLTIWVSRDFVPTSSSEPDLAGLDKRQKARPGSGAVYQTGNADQCGSHARNNVVNSNSPFSGGVSAIKKWGDNHEGYFTVTAQLNKWQNLVVGGSNKGANALYRAQRATGNNIRVGTKDVRSDAEWHGRKAKKIGSSWRAGGYGRETCNSGRRLKYEILKTRYNV